MAGPDRRRCWWPSGLVGVALAFQPLAIVGLSLAAMVLVASFAFAPLRREVPRRRRRPLQETFPTDGAGSSSDTR